MKHNFTPIQKKAIREQIEAYEKYLRYHEDFGCVFCKYDANIWKDDCDSCPNEIMYPIEGCADKRTLAYKSVMAREKYEKGLITQAECDKVIRARIKQLRGWLE